MLENKARLRSNETFDRVYLAPDRTPEERAARRTLVIELKGKRAEFPDKTFIIRGGKVEESVVDEDKLFTLMAFNLADSKEEQESDLKAQIGHMMKIWDFEMTEIKSCYRLGEFIDGTIRPVKLVFKNRDTRKFVLQNNKLIKGSETFGTVYLDPERNVEERVADRKVEDLVADDQ